MKITHIITGLAADGAETALYHLLAALDRQEYQNEVISLTDRGPTAARIEGLGVPVRALAMMRSVPNPLLECLDGADPNASTPVRNTTLTALQALALLNDPFLVRQAEHFAERLQKRTDDRGQQIEAAYRLAFGRPPTAAERDALAAYARKHGLANACRLLFNANEFVFVD